MAYSVEIDTVGNGRVHHRHSAFIMNSAPFPLAGMLLYLNQIQLLNENSPAIEQKDHQVAFERIRQRT